MVETFTMNDVFLVDWDFLEGEGAVKHYLFFLYKK